MASPAVELHDVAVDDTAEAGDASAATGAERMDVGLLGTGGGRAATPSAAATGPPLPPGTPVGQHHAPKASRNPLYWVAAIALGVTIVVVAVLASRPSSEGKVYEWAPVDLDVAEIKAQCDAAMKSVASLRKAMDDRGADVLALSNEIDMVVTDTASTMGLMEVVLPDEGARTEASTCVRTISAKATDLGLDQGMYAHLRAVDAAGLDAVGKRYLNKTLQSFKRSGVDRPESVREQLTILDAEITLLGQTYESNVINDVRTVTVANDEASVGGLPADFVKAHTSADGKTATFSTNYDSYFPVMSYATNETLRRLLKTEFMQRGYPANMDVLQQLLQKRYQYATLLGYENYAAYNQATKMARSTTEVAGFLANIGNIVTSRADSEEQVVLGYKRKDHPGATTLEAYDASYYMNMAMIDKYNVDTKEVRTYFTYESARDGVLAVAAKLFSLRFEIDTTAERWFKDVDVVNVYSLDPEVQDTGFARNTRASSAPPPKCFGSQCHLNNAGVLIGRFYLDMHPRDGKYKHAASFPMVAGVKGKHLTQTALVCNFPATGPMEHSQVVTFFHEFGHNVHTILGGVDQAYSRFSGTATEWDFVEAPSQMDEEWAWDKATLQSFAVNDKGTPIPGTLVDNMRRANDFGDGMGTRQQVFYATLSLQLYDRNPAGLDSTALLQTLQSQLSPYPYMPGTHFQANFGHLVGYSSGYYTYQWSLAIAKDMFTAFQANGMYDKATARAYSRKVLAQGGKQDAADLVRAFLGRPYSFAAYQRWLTQSPTRA